MLAASIAPPPVGCIACGRFASPRDFSLLNFNLMGSQLHLCESCVSSINLHVMSRNLDELLGLCDKR